MDPRGPRRVAPFPPPPQKKFYVLPAYHRNSATVVVLSSELLVRALKLGCLVRNPRTGYIWRVTVIYNGWVRLEQLDGKAFHIRPVREVERLFEVSEHGQANDYQCDGDHSGGD